MVLQAQDAHLHVQLLLIMQMDFQRTFREKHRITHGFFKIPKEISLIKVHRLELAGIKRKLLVCPLTSHINCTAISLDA